MRRAAEHRRHVRLLDDASGVHHDDPVAQLGHGGDVVGDEQHGGTLVAVDLAHEVEDLALHGDVEGGRRLVGDVAAWAVPINPMAITARCFMPPESSCG